MPEKFVFEAKINFVSLRVIYTNLVHFYKNQEKIVIKVYLTVISSILVIFQSVQSDPCLF
jgi:hypothetical protein